MHIHIYIYTIYNPKSYPLLFAIFLLVTSKEHFCKPNVNYMCMNRFSADYVNTLTVLNTLTGELLRKEMFINSNHGSNNCNNNCDNNVPVL